LRRPVTWSTSSKGKVILQDTQKDLQEAEEVLHESQKIDEEISKKPETKGEDPELEESSPQPKLDSYYRFIEGQGHSTKIFHFIIL